MIFEYFRFFSKFTQNKFKEIENIIAFETKYIKG